MTHEGSGSTSDDEFLGIVAHIGVTAQVGVEGAVAPEDVMTYEEYLAQVTAMEAERATLDEDSARAELIDNSLKLFKSNYPGYFNQRALETRAEMRQKIQGFIADHPELRGDKA